MPALAIALWVACINIDTLPCILLRHIRNSREQQSPTMSSSAGSPYNQMPSPKSERDSARPRVKRTRVTPAGAKRLGVMLTAHSLVRPADSMDGIAHSWKRQRKEARRKGTLVGIFVAFVIDETNMGTLLCKELVVMNCPLNPRSPLTHQTPSRTASRRWRNSSRH
ncbi:hypothetical protein BC936DRAFT_142400 [Jimgerdemannia flammicorona]|uniref:Uncharacterized protein n=1 Tax=Jimgerdemannia flammicorona TaxID=994334 RepID=A0A433A0E9_9FUNG|nr:hypothetical protein BC936DRAFT_142400 [Jimgerdemannia flammicorona]